MIFTDEMLNSLPVISEYQDVSDFWDSEEFIQVCLQEYDKTMNQVLDSINTLDYDDDSNSQVLI